MRIALALILVAGCVDAVLGQDPNPKRWEPTIAGFEAHDREKPPPADPIVFTGSSSIARWKGIATAFPEFPVLNRGFGGSVTPDLLHYFDRVVLAYKPKVIVFYCGSNDLASKRSPEQVIGDFRSFVKMTHEKLPGTKIAYISQHVPPSRVKLSAGYAEVNRAVRADAAKDETLRFVDIHDKMLGNDGAPNEELYAADRLHPNEAAYKIWADELRAVLKAAYGPSR